MGLGSLEHRPGTAQVLSHHPWDRKNQRQPLPEAARTGASISAGFPQLSCTAEKGRRGLSCRTKDIPLGT